MIRARPMCLRDVPECVRLVATHPILGPRYGDAIKDLPGVWRRLLDNESFFISALYEETRGGSVGIIGAGISVFVTDDFFQEAKAPPFFWLGPELTRRIAQRRSPLLTEQQVTKANSREGLNLVIWQSGAHPDDLKRPEIWEVGVNAFIECHRGFRLNEWILQAETPEHFVGIFNVGTMLYGDSDGDNPSSRRLDPRQAVVAPHLAGLSRASALKQVGSWAGTVFRYRPPIMGFSRSEQRLLAAASGGGTDEELSKELGLSLSSVKKMWRGAYARVTKRLPTLIPSGGGETVGQERGREKKRHLLVYLREHPEELRPYSPKILEKSARAHLRSTDEQAW